MPRPRKPRGHCKSCNKKLIHSRPAAIYCDNHCQNEHKYSEYVHRWKVGLETGSSINGEAVSDYLRRYLLETRGERCEECHWAQRHSITGRIPLTVHHIDGNYENNAEENLQLLCPNCHSLTPSYGILNRGNGRRVRRKQYRTGP